MIDLDEGRTLAYRQSKAIRRAVRAALVWILDSVDSLPYPEPARGALGLWEWNREGLW